jgi:nicotinamide mononucleotide transporter
MITKKVHEGWIYLIIIDIFSIYLYAGRDLYLSAGLYLIFTGIAVFGWMEWWKIYRLKRVVV